MKQILPYVLVAALAAGAALLFERRGAPQESASAASSADLKAALADVERSLVAIQRLLEARTSAPATARPDSAGLAASPARPLDPNLASPPLPVGRGASDPALPPANYRLLTELADWQEKPESRRRWLFMSDAEMLKRYGAPDKVTAGAGEETWIYENEAGTYTLILHAGRLIDAYFSGK